MREPAELAMAVRCASPSLNDTDRIAAMIAAKLGPAEAREIATLWLAEQARSIIREEALAAERSAQAARAREIDEQNASPESIERGRQFRQDLDDLRTAREGRLVAGITRAMEVFASELRMEWTAELLATEFRLPDGTAMTWGVATIDDHEARRAMFAANAVANAEGAARHIAAIEVLRTSGAACLNDLVGATV